jgi:FAD synthetase
MQNKKMMDIIKAAYLTQLRHGPFTAEELGQRVAGDAPGQLQNAEYFQMQTADRVTRYSLTAAGRGLIKVALAGGVYDVLHVGHLAALREAKELGDVLVVVVATDITVEMLKGRKPILPEEDRRELVEGLKPVDKAILGYEDVGFGFEEVLMEVLPDLVAFGYDQEKLEATVSEIIQRRNLKIAVVKLSRFDREKYASSTSLKQKLAEASK